MRLYEYDVEIQNLLETVDPETGELPDDTFTRLEEIMKERQITLGEILDDMALAYRNATAEAISAKAEKQKLDDLRAKAENRAEAIKRRIDDMMQRNGLDKHAGDRMVKLSYRKSERVEITDESVIPTSYMIPQPATVNKTSIKQALKMGAAIPGAKLVTAQNLQIK